MALLSTPSFRTTPVIASLITAIAMAGGFVQSAAAQVLTQDEALALAFGGATIERETAYLEDAQLEAARELAGPGVRVETGIVTYYVAIEAGSPVGVAYFDAHRVRTMEEVLMITVGRDGRVGRVETVAFREPPEYMAPEGWLDLFDARTASAARPIREVPNIAGATLTADAVKRATRRVLALHRVIDPFGDSPDGQREPR